MGNRQDANNVFDRISFYQDVENGDLPKLLIDFNTEDKMPYAYKLGINGKLYVICEDAIKVKDEMEQVK